MRIGAGRPRTVSTLACVVALAGLGLTFTSTGSATYGKGNGLLGFQASPKGCALGARAADFDDCDFPDIATAKSNGSGGKKVVGSGAQPSFSPSGQSLAFVEEGLGPGDCFSDETLIVIAPSGGGAPKQVTKCKDGLNEEAPSFSPRGTRIAFESVPSFAVEGSIVSTTLTGAAPAVLAADGSQPSWGSNGRIAFVRGGHIWTMKGDGSDQIRVTKSKAADFSPDWSPGASRIVFARNGEVYTMTPDGKSLRRLTNNGTSEGDPVWAPDGNRIAFAVRRRRIDVMKPDGKGRTKNVVRNGRQPAWQPKQ